MKELQLKFARQYRKQPTEKQRAAELPGTIVYVYKVSGDKAHIDAYLESKKDFIKSIKEEDGSINYFSIRVLKNPNGTVPNLMLTSKNEWVPNTAEADQLANLTTQYGHDIAKDMMKKTVAE